MLPRLLGVVLFALGVFVAQVIRHRPFFLVLIGIVGPGVVLTGAAFLRERREAA